MFSLNRWMVSIKKLSPFRYEPHFEFELMNLFWGSEHALVTPEEIKNKLRRSPNFSSGARAGITTGQKLSEGTAKDLISLCKKISRFQYDGFEVIIEAWEQDLPALIGNSGI